MKYLILTILLLGVGATAVIASQSPPPSDYAVSGQVTDELGQPIGDVRVCAYPDDYEVVRRELCSRSKVTGDFLIPNLRPVGYTIFAEKAGASYFRQFPFYQHPDSVIHRVRLTEARKTATVFISLPPKNGQLVGKAIDSVTGRPIDNLTFVTCQVSVRQKCWTTHAKNAQGEFKIFAAHVPFTLRVFAEGYDPYFGITGADINEPIFVPSGSKIEVLLTLRRAESSAERAIDEAEKQAGINLSAPEQTAPAEASDLNYFPRKTKLEWKPVDGAVFYRVEIDYCDGLVKSRKKCVDPRPHYRERQESRDIYATSYEFNFVGAQPGRWRVWAVDEKGREGFKSPWRTFFYLQ